jgi:hypothetical protein
MRSLDIRKTWRLGAKRKVLAQERHAKRHTLARAASRGLEVFRPRISLTLMYNWRPISPGQSQLRPLSILEAS